MNGLGALGADGGFAGKLLTGLCLSALTFPLRRYFGRPGRSGHCPLVGRRRSFERLWRIEIMAEQVPV